MSSDDNARSGDPFQRLIEHAASRSKMTKAQLLLDAAHGDEAYINACTERDMYEAAYDDLWKAAQEVVDRINSGVAIDHRHPSFGRLRSVVLTGETR